ncbi:DUF4190 domain-containing protein [Micromonospora sp. NPDC005173]|uniref:DUF4190 domain-containing protein n=1 Tax=Micromonospora sp. NPDC005173 TaxID=3157165 RepID=UPI0033A8FECA
MSYHPGYDPHRPALPASAPPASPGPYPPIAYPPAHIVVHAPPTSGLAVASLVLGILGVVGGWCLFGVPCLLAVVLGHVGLHDTRNDMKSGRGMAVAGLVLGYVFVAPMIMLTMMVFFGGLIGAATPSTTPSP